MDPYVELALKAIKAYVNEGKTTSPPDPLPADMYVRRGVFVSIKKLGELRGCIGTILPAAENMAAEITANAVASAAFDPRFPPVSPEEIEELEVSVDVLSEPVPVTSTDELDAKTFGIIVGTADKRGLLLPDLEGVDTPEEQIAICRRKGGIAPYEKVGIWKFTVERHK